MPIALLVQIQDSHSHPLMQRNRGIMEQALIVVKNLRQCQIERFLFSHSLRTSETSYLNEAFSFYSAIRQRSYYSQVNKEDRYALECFQRQEWKTLNVFSSCANCAEMHTFVYNFYSFHGSYRVPTMCQASSAYREMLPNGFKHCRCCNRCHHTSMQSGHKGGMAYSLWERGVTECH